MRKGKSDFNRIKINKTKKSKNFYMVVDANLI